MITLGVGRGRNEEAIAARRQQFGAQEDLDESSYGDVTVALKPIATTFESYNVAKLFTFTARLCVLDMSHSPRAYYGQGAFTYTAYADTMKWIDMATNPGFTLLGQWAVTETLNPSGHYFDAVKYSGVFAIAKGPGGMGIYGPQMITAVHASTCIFEPDLARHYAPSYNTISYNLEVYDDRLWRTDRGRASYLEPAVNTLDAIWSDYIEVGDPTIFINNTAVFNGRLYFGKVDGLWVFDAGRVYMVEDFSHIASAYNFGVMIVYRGALYFNIFNSLYRLTTGGLIEKISMPTKGGPLVSADILDDKLYVMEKGAGASLFDPGEASNATGGIWSLPKLAGSTDVWVFNRESGGTHEWINFDKYIVFRNLSLNSLKQCKGVLWIAPVIMTSNANISSVPERSGPIAVLRPDNPDRTFLPEVAKEGSWLTTSCLSFGHKDLTKLFDKAKIDYVLHKEQDAIDVYYRSGEVPKPVVDRILQIIWTEAYPGYTHTDIQANLTDGTFLSAVNMTFDTGSTKCLLFGLKSKPQVLDLMFYWNNTDTTYYDRLVQFRERAGLWYLDENGARHGFHGGGYQLKGYGEFQMLESYTNFYDLILPPGLPGRVCFHMGMVTDPTNAAWKKCTAYNVVDNWTQDDPAEIEDPYEELYWLYLDPHNAETYPIGKDQAYGYTVFEVAVDGKMDVSRLKEPDWILLGSITGESDFYNTRKALTFPGNTSYREIALRFEFRSWGGTRPTLTGYELEYIEEPSNLEIIDFTTVATDDLQQISMAVDNSAMLVEAALFSMSKSGLLYTVQVPWPSNHTIRARVSISPPGAFVPFPSVNTRLSQDTPSEIPVRLEEM